MHPWPGAETGVVLRVSWETRTRCPVQGDKSQAGTKEKGKSGLSRQGALSEAQDV